MLGGRVRKIPDGHGRTRVYGEEFTAALRVLWEATYYVCALQPFTGELADLLVGQCVAQNSRTLGMLRLDAWYRRRSQPFGIPARPRGKFVVVETQDLVEVARLVEVFGLEPVYVMPEGVSEEVLRLRTQEIAGEVLARGWNLTTRLHILLYGNRRGV